MYIRPLGSTISRKVHHMIIYFILFLLWISLLLILVLKITKLKQVIHQLPKVYLSGEYKDPLIGQDIKKILELPSSYTHHKESIIMVMSPTCMFCHDKLDEIIDKNKHKSHNLILYIDSKNKEFYNQFVEHVHFKSTMPVYPLSIVQQKKLRVFAFPAFIHIDSQGIITRNSTIADKLI